MNIEMSSPEFLDSEKDLLNRDTNLPSCHLKRLNENHSAESLLNKKARLNENTQILATGVVMVHVAFNSHIYTKYKDIRLTDIGKAINALEGGFFSIKNDLVRFSEEIVGSASQSLNISQAYASDTMLLDSESLPLTVKEEYTEYKDDENPLNESNESENKFKSPQIFDRVKVTKARLSSSTSSSSVPASSSNEQRYSIASASTQSDTSSDLLSKKSDILLATDSSDNSVDKFERTCIENCDDDEEATCVYARWKNEKYFYSGRVKGHLFQAEVQVCFDDLTIETIKKTDIIYRELLPIGVEVMVDLEKSGNFENNFVIIGHDEIRQFRRKPKKGYIVKCNKNNVKHTVSRDCVSVHQDAVRKILQSEGHSDSTSVTDFHNMSTSNISVDNIVEGKRNIKWKRFSQFVSPDLTRVQRCNSPSLLTLSTSPYRQRPKKKPLVKKISGSSINSSEVDKLFSNWYIMVTQETDQEDPGSLSKDNVEETIKTYGGQIIDIPDSNMIELNRKNQRHIVLIVLGNSYNTLKFMTALAVGNVPIVSGNWLEECVRTSSIVSYDHFLVPRGLDEEQKEILQKLDNSDTINLFESRKIWIVTDSIETFGNQWKMVLEISGADVTLIDTSNFSTDISSYDCDFALIEPDGVTRNCLRYLRGKAIEVVNIRYVMASLIHNRVLDRAQYKE